MCCELYISSMSSTYLAQNSMFSLSNNSFISVLSIFCKNMSAIVLEMEEGIEISLSGWYTILKEVIFLENDTQQRYYLLNGWCVIMFQEQRFSKKVKAVPLQAWHGPEGSRKSRFPDLMTTAQDNGKIVSLTHRLTLPPGNAPGTHFCQRLSRLQGHSAI